MLYRTKPPFAASVSLIVAALALSGCTTLTGKSGPAASVQAAQTTPVDADIQKILSAGGIDPGQPQVSALVGEQVAGIAPPPEAPDTVVVPPVAAPVAVAELTEPGVQNIEANQIYTFPTPAISMVPASFEGTVLPTFQNPSVVGALPPAPLDERITIISGPDAQPLEAPKSKPKKTSQPKPAAVPECIRLARANIPDPACEGQGAAVASEGPSWRAPAISTNVATPAAPVKRF